MATVTRRVAARPRDYVRVAGPDAGSVVHGSAADWDEPSRVAQSFEEFLRSFTAEAASSNAEFPYSLFL